jgi:hypothetical protein
MMLIEITRLHPLGDLVGARSPVSSASESVASSVNGDQFSAVRGDSHRFTRFTGVESPPDPLTGSTTAAI